jgi:methionyl-tRNA formyltransferase
MQMDAGLDTGPMLLARETEIGTRETSGHLHDRLAVLGAKAVVAAIDAWTEGRIVPVPQPASGATYAAKIRKEEARIDWTQPAIVIARAVRAFNPWPVAETLWRGQQLRIWDATARPEVTGGAPGTVVVETGTGHILVTTGAGSLQLDTLQMPGRKPTAAAEFLRAHTLDGAQLGAIDE